jgi:hypothetical protein
MTKATIIRQQTDTYFARINKNFAPCNLLCNNLLQLLKQLDCAMLNGSEDLHAFETLLLDLVNTNNMEHHNYPSVEVIISKYDDEIVYILPHVATINIFRANVLQFKTEEVCNG